MAIIQQVIQYLFPVLLALALLYFAVGIAYIKYIKKYEKIAKGKDMAFTALAAMFWILTVWAVVYSIVALFG